jgi:hypothetical protein
MRPHRIFTLLTTMAVTMFAAPIARASEPTAPVLWEGRIVGADGHPASGTEVVAFARPAGADLQPTEAELVPVARTTTDDAGRYVLRSGHTAALRSVETTSGWTNVMVAAFAPDGSFSLATDSLAWAPAGGVHGASVDDSPNRGRWVTTPADRAAGEAGTFRAAAASDPETVNLERPAVMTLQQTDRPIRAQVARPPDGRRYGMCAGPYKTENLGMTYTPVGELHLDRAWSGQFAYSTTRSTTFQVGVRIERGGWEAGGSTSSLKDATVESGNDQGLSENHMYTFAADIDYQRTVWRCTRGDAWHSVEMVEPSRWRGGLHRTDFGPVPACDPAHTSPVTPQGYARRHDGESTTIAGAIAVAGFVGATTTTVTKGVAYGWTNHVDHERFLCGSSDFVTGNTRIRSLP